MRSPTWIDNHCHLSSAPDVAEQLADARAAGVVACIAVGTTVEDSARCLAIAEDSDSVWATAGVHPHDAAGGTEGLEELLRSGKRSGLLVAVGECGLDYHYMHSPADAQREAFRRQIGLAHQMDLPLVIHSRDAWSDTFELLDEEGAPRRTVFHCFSGGSSESTEVLARGALLSISGIVTFPSAVPLREAVAGAPIDRLMVETDSPYLAPIPFRGKRNTPAKVVRVGEEIAELKGTEVGALATVLRATTESFYGLQVPVGASAERSR